MERKIQMAKSNYTLKFASTFINVAENTLTEITKDGENTYVLTEVLEKLEDKALDITFSEKQDIYPQEEE